MCACAQFRLVAVLSHDLHVTRPHVVSHQQHINHPQQLHTDAGATHETALQLRCCGRSRGPVLRTPGPADGRRRLAARVAKRNTSARRPHLRCTPGTCWPVARDNADRARANCSGRGALGAHFRGFCDRRVHVNHTRPIYLSFPERRGAHVMTTPAGVVLSGGFLNEPRHIVSAGAVALVIIQFSISRARSEWHWSTRTHTHTHTRTARDTRQTCVCVIFFSSRTRFVRT